VLLLREKVRDLENLLRRKESELSSQKTKINQLQTSLKYVTTLPSLPQRVCKRLGYLHANLRLLKF
jgi:hypothetical protein